MSYVDAAAIPHAVCLAVQGLIDVGQLQPGERLLINGEGGGVGTLGMQIAKYMGVEGVSGVDSADKFDMMRSVGFEHVIDYKQEDFTKNGRQYDLILDAKTKSSFPMPTLFDQIKNRPHLGCHVVRRHLEPDVG